MATTQQPLNPYIAGRAVGGKRGFFGGQDILREVERTLTADDTVHYQRIVVALKETIRLMEQIDEIIEAHGGWPIE